MFALIHFRTRQYITDVNGEVMVFSQLSSEHNKLVDLGIYEMVVYCG